MKRIQPRLGKGEGRHDFVNAPKIIEACTTLKQLSKTRKQAAINAEKIQKHDFKCKTAT